MLGIQIEYRAAVVLRDKAIISGQVSRGGCKKENIRANGLHQHLVMDRIAHTLRTKGFRLGMPWPKRKAIIRRTALQVALVWVRPNPAVEQAEAHSAPFQIEGAIFVAIDLNVHHYRIRLLY